MGIIGFIGIIVIFFIFLHMIASDKISREIKIAWSAIIVLFLGLFIFFIIYDVKSPIETILVEEYRSDKVTYFEFEEVHLIKKYEKNPTRILTNYRKEIFYVIEEIDDEE